MAQATHTRLGDVAIVVGHYKKGDDTKKRYRNIGILMETDEGDGTFRHWLKLDAEILQPALFSLVYRENMKPGDDQFSAAVFAPREEKGAGGAPVDPDAKEDDIPF